MKVYRGFESRLLRMKKFKETLSIVKLCLEIIFFIFSFFGIKTVFDLLKINSTILMVVLFVVMIGIFWLIWDKSKRISSKLNHIIIESEFNNIALQKEILNISNVIPKTKTLEILTRKLINRAKLWSDDAVFISINLYLKYDKEFWQKPILQAYFSSKWKNEEACFYEGQLKSETYFEIGSNLAHGNENSIMFEELFFVKNKFWNKTIEKAYKKIATRVSNKVDLQITQDTIRITYIEGKVNKTKNYKVNKQFDLINQ